MKYQPYLNKINKLPFKPTQTKGKLFETYNEGSSQIKKKRDKSEQYFDNQLD